MKDHLGWRIGRSEPEIRRGEHVGVPREPVASDADHYYRCAECGGWVDKRDLGAVFGHEPGGPHPASDKPRH